jgi:predicted MPP superfamily phosphohydrolase
MAWVRYGEPHRFEVTRNPIVLPGIRPKRILQISDIHMSDGMTAEELEIGVVAGLESRPDLICVTGDFVSTTAGFDRPGLLRLLRRLSPAAPTFAVLGNHDGGDWLARCGGSGSTRMIRQIVASAGIRMLHNESSVFDDLTLVGVGDYWSGELDPDRAFAKAPAAAATILLCHNPDAKQSVGEWRWNLMLSGHTHGGQVCIPGINPTWTPVWDKRFVAGLYAWEGRQIFINRGLGSPKHIRAFCRPEVSVLEVG